MIAVAPALLLLAGAPLVFVEPTPQRSAFVDSLELEIGEEALVDTATAATHQVRVERRDGALLVTVRTGGELLVARTIEGERPAAARRVAVLLVARSLSVPIERPRPPPPPPPDQERFVVSPQAFAGWWQTPGVAPQLGLLVSAAYENERFGGGVVLAAAGGLCCARRTSNVDGSSVDLHAVLEGRVSVFDLGAARLMLHAGGGVSAYLATLRPIFPASPSEGSPQRVDDLQVIVLGAASLRAPLTERLSFVARISVRWALVGQRVLLPAFYETDEPVVTGRVGPWLSLGVAWDPFS